MPLSPIFNMEEIFSNNDILRYAVEQGMIDVSAVQKDIAMKRRYDLLDKHPYDIWEGKNGKWYTYLPEGNGRVQRVRNTRDEIESIVIEFWKGKEENPTVQEMFTEWNDRRLNLGKISDPTHLRNKQTFSRHFSVFGKRKVKNLTPYDVCDFLEEEIADKQLTSKAFSGLKGLTKGILKRAKKRGFITWNVEETLNDMDLTDRAFKKVIKDDSEEVFDEDETEAMLDYLKNNLDVQNTALLLTFVTGIRVGELVALKHEDFKNNTVTIRRMERKILASKGHYDYIIKETPKTEAGIRTIVIPDSYKWLLDRIRLMNPFGEYVFTDVKGNRLTTNSIRRRAGRNCDRLGIKRRSPHKIRKTYGSILLDNNIDKKLIIEMMGHTDVLTTERHYHRNRKSMERKAQIISALPDFNAKTV